MFMIKKIEERKENFHCLSGLKIKVNLNQTSNFYKTNFRQITLVFFVHDKVISFCTMLGPYYY